MLHAVDQILFYRWSELLAERLDEAIAELCTVDGVVGLVVGGSVGRGEPWPLSDIDILPILVSSSGPNAELERRRSFLIDWWAASGRAQTLDMGWICFTAQEVEQAIDGGAPYAASQMGDRRWFHGLDKAYGGWGTLVGGGADGLAQTFATWVTAVRFDPAVVATRVAQWWLQVEAARTRALDAVRASDPVAATLALREAARGLRLVLIEGWGERLGSMGREWTRFERMAQEHGMSLLATRLARLAAAQPELALERATRAPVWLQTRINLALAARLTIGEEVTPAENARDQLAAFAVHVPRYRPAPWGEWIGVPDPDLAGKFAELDEVIAILATRTY